MNNLTKELKRICTYHSDDGTSGYLLSEEQFEAIRSLLTKTTEQIIGENDKQIMGKSIDDFKYPTAKIRNQLRLEQRKKAATLLGIVEKKDEV